VIAIPALDLRDGACVQLVGGDYAREALRRPDPLAMAAEFAALGFAALHVVDLDAATGRGSNGAVLAAMLAARAAAVQVGGGLRDGASLDALLAAGAARVVAGTRALEDPAWLAAVAARAPGRLVVAVDVRGRVVQVRGWRAAHRVPLGVTLAALDALPLAGVLVTAVHREGRAAGPDLALYEESVAATRHPVQAAGGIASLADLRALAARGVSAAVLGMAIYSGALDPRAVAEEFGR
jgi:phosphoribosylformimino-5-aminoimidazole carboxamide ribotide isomerase